MSYDESLEYRLRTRAAIRREIPSRKSVQEGKEDRLAVLLEEAAAEIEDLRNELDRVKDDRANLMDEIEYYRSGRCQAF